MSGNNKNKTAKLRSIMPSPVKANGSRVNLNTLNNSAVRNIANERALQALTIAAQNEDDRKGYANNMSGLMGTRANIRHDPNMIRTMNLVQKGPRKRTPLMFAAMKGDLERVKELVKSAPWSLYLEDYNIQTALSWAASEGKDDVVKVLLAAQSDDVPMPGYLENALYNASEKGYINIVRILIDAGADVNYDYFITDSPIHMASQNGHIDILRLLIEAGGDIERRDNGYELTPIFYAIEGNQIECLKVLIEAGANLEESNNINNITPIFYSIEKGKIECLRLLIRGGANINRENGDGDIPIFQAIENNNVHLLKILIEEGANLEIENYEGFTPIFQAINNNNVHLLKFLIEGGANIEHEDHEEGTPIFYAITKDNLPALNFLITSGANIKKINNNRQTPIAYVRELILRRNEDDVLWNRYKNIEKKLVEANKILQDVEKEKIKYVNTRNVPKGSTNSLSLEEINEGNIMINFPRNNTKTEYNVQSYYKNIPQVHELKRNPFSRKSLIPSNFKYYKAHLVDDIVLGNNPLSAINVNKQEGGKKIFRKTRKRKTNNSNTRKLRKNSV